MLLLWLSLFKVETGEELEKFKAMEVLVMSQAINAYYTITDSSEFHEKELHVKELHVKARHDDSIKSEAEQHLWFLDPTLTDVK